LPIAGTSWAATTSSPWRDAVRSHISLRNPARRAVYDREEGRVYDGIDHGVLNVHSGAESNVVGGQALLDQVIRTAPLIAPLIEGCFGLEMRDRFGAQAAASR
jgi:hypothetical protein